MMKSELCGCFNSVRGFLISFSGINKVYIACPGFVACPGLVAVRGLSCLGFVVSDVCLSGVGRCPGFVVSDVGLSGVCRSTEKCSFAAFHIQLS